MGYGFKHGVGGGSELAFRVLAGLEQPASPRENDIWVDTDTAVTGWHFGADDPNLLDFTTWANGIDVHLGTKSVSGNSVTLTANASGDCHTDYAATSKAKIPCTPGKTYIMQWDHSGSDGWVYLFPNADMAGLVLAAAEGGKLEYTAEAGVTFFTFRIGVQEANAIAVYSNIRITEKDRAFSPGSVWITTGATSPVSFNAVKKNGLMVYPLSVKQYIGGSWVVKEASIYQSGEWVQFSSYWDGYYFKDGDQYEEITGGWTSEGWDNSATATIGETLIVSANGNATGRMGIANPVDLTNVNTLWYDSPNGNNGANNSGYLCIADAKTYGSGNRVASAMIRNAGTGSIDVSNLSGEHYLYLYAMGSSGATAYADIRAIWGE